MRRIFGGISEDNAFIQNLDSIEKARFGMGTGSTEFGGDYSTLLDGMEKKLNDAAKYFEFNPDEINQEDYTFRTDMNFKPGVTYNPEVCIWMYGS